ncbi:MAG: hypothetical protein M1819_002423 [Sarea resinae]|nr:MAG: hypothetical protein M1819_002423 [Sarea resinae]
MILPRQGYYYGGGNYCNGSNCGNSNWYNWGRWVVLAAILVAAFGIFVIVSCVNARRRRHAGLTPYRGTGWLGGKTPPGHGEAQYAPGQQPYYQENYQPQDAPAPPYSPPPVHGYYGENQTYYGQQSGIELQQPPNAYQPQRGGDPVYAPPPGSPPGHAKMHEDGVIR